MPENSTESTILIPVTGKQIGIAIIAILTLVGGYPIASFFSPNVRNDPFTGAEGRVLEDRIEELEFKSALGVHDAGECAKRDAALERRVEAHWVYSANKVENFNDEFARLRTQTKINENLITQCLRKTQ